MAEFGETTRATLEGAFADTDRILALAERILAAYPELGGERYESGEISQLLHGFAALVREELQGGGSTRSFYFETAIPAVVARGETPASLARSATLFAILLADEVTHELEGTERAEAVSWLAQFFGDYAHDVVAAAQEAS